MASKMKPSDRELRAQIQMARQRELDDRRTGLRASAAEYDGAGGVLRLRLTNGVEFAFPPTIAPVLRDLSRAQLAEVELSPSGDGIEWAAYDIHLSVPGLILSAFPAAELRSQLARVAGLSRSAAKSRAARRNGAKGGRPPKSKAR